MSKHIIICDPSSDWPEDFVQIANKLRTMLGSAATRIDHIGSTAVSGLAAKDVIDIQISVTDLQQTDVITRLIDGQFEHLPHVTHDLLVGLSPDDAGLQKAFFRQAPGMKTAHIHIRENDRLNQNYPLLFRDFLRDNAVVRQAYEDLKRQLAKRFSSDPDSYYDIKDPYMDTVYEAAKLWAEKTGWCQDANFI